MPRAASTLKLMVIALVVLVVLVIGLAAFVLTRLGVDRTPVTLALRLEPGRQYVYRHTIGLDGSGGMTVSMTMSIVSSLAAESVDEQGDMHLRAQVDEIKLKQSAGPGASLSYDSTDPSSTPPPGMDVLAQLVGTPVKLVLSPAGKVVSVEGMGDESESDQTAAAPPGMQGLSGESVEQMVKESFEQGLHVYPPGPVAIGDTWKAELAGLSELPMDVEAEVLYKLRDRSDGRAYVDLSGNLEAEETQNMPAGKLTVAITADIDGKLIMEEATGCILSSDAEIDMKMDVKGGGGLMGARSESMKMKMTMQQQLVQKGYSGTE